MTSSPRIYFDNAATSWPKPEGVYQAVDQYQRQNGSAAGRSAYQEAMEVDRLIANTRRDLAQFFNAEAPRQIAFAFSGTDALNMAIHGVLRPGDHVITTAPDHNSVLRPLRTLQDAGQIEVAVVGCNELGVVDPAEIQLALRPNTRLVAITHASNVTGMIQPVAEAAAIARLHGAFTLVDAAQTAGHVPIDVRKMQCDLLAVPGHKGLLGPLGTGLLYISPWVEKALHPFRQGGTGTASDSDRQPEAMPERFEPGNHNVLGLAGLGAAMRFMLEADVAALEQRLSGMLGQLLAGLRELPGARVLGSLRPEEHAGLVSFTLKGYHPQEVAAVLDGANIQVRAGLHCAPLMHAALGTVAEGGSIRVSLGIFNTESQVDALLHQLRGMTA